MKRRRHVAALVFPPHGSTRRGMALPVLLFFLAQRFFMRGIVITGVDK